MKSSANQRSKRNKGAVLTEAVAALCLLLPIIVAIVFVGLEVSRAYLLKSSLSEAAREAARDLAIAYGLDPTVASSRTAAESNAYDKIRIPSVVASSAQFSDPVWNSTASPPTVTVTVNYTSNQNGLPAFPNPDPLHIGNNFQIAGTATYRLQ